MSHEHLSGKVCQHRTLKECDEAYAEFQARSQVELARRIAAAGNADRFRGDDTVFGQLVRIAAGQQADFVTKNGVASEASFTRRLRVLLQVAHVAD